MSHRSLHGQTKLPILGEKNYDIACGIYNYLFGKHGSVFHSLTLCLHLVVGDYLATFISLTSLYSSMVSIHLSFENDLLGKEIEGKVE